MLSSCGARGPLWRPNRPLDAPWIRSIVIATVTSSLLLLQPLGRRWMRNSPQTVYARRITPVYIWRKQARIVWSGCVFSLVSYCHIVKLCALANRNTASRAWPRTINSLFPHDRVISCDSYPGNLWPERIRSRRLNRRVDSWSFDCGRRHLPRCDVGCGRRLLASSGSWPLPGACRSPRLRAL